MRKSSISIVTLMKNPYTKFAHKINCETLVHSSLKLLLAFYEVSYIPLSRAYSNLKLNLTKLFTFFPCLRFVF